MYWWSSLEKERRINHEPPIQYWNELHSALRRRYIPPYYDLELMDKLQRLKQGSSSVNEYRKTMELLMMRAGIREEDMTTISRFQSGFNLEIRDKVELLPYRYLNELVQLYSFILEWNIKLREFIKCFKCLVRGHIASQCPTKKTMVLKSQDHYSSLDEATSSSSSSEDEAIDSKKEILPCEGDLLLVRRLLSNQSSEMTIYDGLTIKISSKHLGKKFVWCPLSPFQVNEDQLKLKAKKDEEEKNKRKTKKKKKEFSLWRERRARFNRG
uniref:CCHC-type domain-containing protein n=1 Tax=Cajanus cajan TaxID=3821 RepID=A0A151RG99_CAJCA|nr:hypothetical protein KK1_037042 [Cajanus cajan]